MKDNWKKVTRDDAFSARIQYVLDDDYRREVFRHLDVSLKKMELKPRLYRRAIKSYLDRRKNGKLDMPPCTAVIPEPAESVSDQPLPFLWEPMGKQLL
jgi:hypothetical protein